MWIVYASLSAIAAGITTIFLKKGVRTTNTSVALALRTLVVLVFSIIIVAIVGSQGQIYLIDKKTWLFLVLSGLSTGAGWYYYYKALQNGPTSAVAAIDKLSVLVAVVLSYFIFNKKMKAKEVIGLLLILIGTIGLAFKL